MLIMMRMWTTSTLGALALAVLSLAAAGPSWAVDCAKAGTQTGLNGCAGQTRSGADEALNVTYGTLVKQTTVADRLDKLRAAERAWVAFRDAQCTFEGSQYEGASMQPMVIEECAEGLTKDRTAELKRVLACAKSGGSC